MCKGMDDWAIEIGVQASIEAWQDADFPMEDILSRLERKYHLTEEAALAYYKQFSLQTV